MGRSRIYNIIGIFGQNLEQWIQVDAVGQWNLVVNNRIRDNIQIKVYQVKKDILIVKK